MGDKAGKQVGGDAVDALARAVAKFEIEGREATVGGKVVVTLPYEKLKAALDGMRPDDVLKFVVNLDDIVLRMGEE